jgi:hypothetical protein
MAAAVAIGSLSALAQPSKKPGAQALDIAQERGDKALTSLSENWPRRSDNGPVPFVRVQVAGEENSSGKSCQRASLGAAARIYLAFSPN